MTQNEILAERRITDGFHMVQVRALELKLVEAASALEEQERLFLERAKEFQAEIERLTDTVASLKLAHGAVADAEGVATRTRETAAAQAKLFDQRIGERERYILLIEEALLVHLRQKHGLIL